MTVDGQSPVGSVANVKNSADDHRTTGLRVLWTLMTINAIALITLIGLLYFDRGASTHSSTLLSNLRWWSQPWGVHVPAVVGKADSAAAQGAAVLGSLLALFTLILAATAAFISRGPARLIILAIGLFLAGGWVSVGRDWDGIRLRGQSAELAQYAEPVSKFAKELDTAWPNQSGEIEDFGAFLAYPYGEPRTLLMLGDARIPDTPLRVAAVERTPDEAIRFQLTGDAANVWFEWRITDTTPTAFRGGLEQAHTPTTYSEIAANTFVVRYSIAGPEPASGQFSSASSP